MFSIQKFTNEGNHQAMSIHMGDDNYIQLLTATPQ